MARVIVVDDEEIVAHMIGLLVEDMGHQPVVAANGAEALALLTDSADPPALIISDIAMPDMSGVELARAVKATPTLHDVPVILMSAGSHYDGPAADHFLSKPFDLDDVHDLIETYVH